MTVRLLLKSLLWLALVDCQTRQPLPTAAPKEKSLSVVGRLPGAKWRELDPPLKGSVQTLETTSLLPPCQLLLYVKQNTEQTAGQFMADFATRLSLAGKEVVKRENLVLSNGVWLNFTAINGSSVSRVYARKEGQLILWVLFVAPDEKNYALFAPDAERYVAQLKVVGE